MSNAKVKDTLTEVEALRETVEDLCDVILQLTDVDDLVERVNAEPERFRGFRAAVERAGQVLDGTPEGTGEPPF